MKKLILALLLVATSQAQAESIWARDCVKWWGGDIPLEERNSENCPSGTNHWDSSRRTEQGASYTGPSHTGGLTAGTNFSGSTTTSTGMTAHTYNLPSASYMVIRSGSTTTVLQTSKSR